MTYPYPTIAVQASLTTDRFDTPSWSSFAAEDVEAFDVEQGRQSEFDSVEAAKFSVELGDTTRLYDPRNTAGAYYPNLRPGRRARITATYDEDNGLATPTYVGAGAFTSGDNASLTPALPASWSADDLFICFASIRNSGTGTVNVPDDWFTIVSYGNVALLGHYAVLGDVAPTITFTGGASGDTTLAQVAVWRDVELDPANLIIGSATQLNASAQNIAVPALTVGEAAVVLVAGWKQDDWTSVAPLSGFAEAIDASSTTGNDAGLVVDYRIQSSAGNVSSTSLVVTGGASAISRAVVVALRPYRGRVCQLVNGFTDSFTADYRTRMGTVTMKGSGPFRSLALTTMSDPYSVAIGASSPTAWYRLDDVAGHVLTDSSGNGRHGTWVPASVKVQSTDGLIASADGAVTLPASPTYSAGKIPVSALPTLAPLSVEFWVQIDKLPKSPDFPVELAAADYSYLLLGGGVNVRVYSVDGSFPGALEFVVSDDPSLSVAHLAQASTISSLAGPTWYSICDGRPHHVVCTLNAAATVARVFVDGQNLAFYDVFTGTVTGGGYGAVEVNAAGAWDGSCVIDEIAFYSAELSSSDVALHYEAGMAPWSGDLTGERITNVLAMIGWPPALQDLDDGQTVLGTANLDGDALSYIDRLVTGEQGLLFEDHHNDGAVRFVDRLSRLTSPRSTTAQTVFSDQSTDLSTGVAYSAIGLATDARPAANIVSVKWVGGTATTVDQSSIDAYGEIPVTLSTEIETWSEASNLADWVLGEQSALFDRIRSITIRPSGMNGTAAQRAWIACLTRRVGDRVQVRHQPVSTGAVIDQQAWIIGIEHHVSDGVSNWETTFWLVPAITTVYWSLGTGALDSTARLAY